jgi:excisionase family DNA binding protein
MTVEYFSTRQVAERLHVPVSMVVHLLASGELSGTKVNNRWRVALPALKKFLEDARPNRTWQRKAPWR